MERGIPHVLKHVRIFAVRQSIAISTYLYYPSPSSLHFGFPRPTSSFFFTKDTSILSFQSILKQLWFKFTVIRNTVTP